MQGPACRITTYMCVACKQHNSKQAAFRSVAGCRSEAFSDTGQGVCMIIDYDPVEFLIVLSLPVDQMKCITRNYLLECGTIVDAKG